MALRLYSRLAVLMAEYDPRLSQSRLSKEAGVSKITLNRLRTNKPVTGIDETTIVGLCQFFGCELGDLLVLRDEEKEAEGKEAAKSEKDVS